ncbi:MAG TPA: AraC family transcriptional regulator [Acetobacteraceae bacterium]|jgi:AraC family transcriptional regulator|nr:AraC family transcriptional regulator [Acetobacteraceae bacterium]
MSNAVRIGHGPFGRVALLDMDQGLVRHAHPHCHVLLKGGGEDTQFSVGDDLADLTDDSAVLINAWEPHAYVHRPQSPRSKILALYIEPKWLSLFRHNWAASGGPGFFTSHAGGVTQQIRNLADELAQAMLADPKAGTAHQALLGTLMVAVIERFSDWRRVSPTGNRLDWRVRRAIATIRRDPGAVADMGKLARESGLSRAHFFRLFSEATGMAPGMFANMLRMEASVGELVTGQRSMAEVSDDLGFSAPAHFTRFFRSHAGSAPSEFRSIARLQQAA